MKGTRFKAAAAGVLIILGAFLTGPAAAAAKTSDALPAWTAPHAVLHLEKIPEAASRLAGSFLLDELLELFPVFPVQKDAVVTWLENFPVESVSLVRGTMYDDEDTFQGAVRFSEDAQEFLEQLTEGKAIDDQESFMASLLGLLESESLREVFGLSIEPSDEGKKLYEVEISSYVRVFLMPSVDWEFLASVEKSGEEYVLLIGSSAEDVEKARGALGDEKKRLKIRRRAEHANFFQIDDDGKGSMTEDLVDGLSFEPRAGASLEFSLGLGEDKIDLSLRHNLFEVAFGGAEKPKAALTFQEPGFKFGGGTPWFAGMSSVLLTEDDALGLLTFIAGGNKAEAVEFLNENGIDPGVVLRAIRSFGVVLGSDSTLKTEDSGETDAPGGYVFVSGEPERMRELIPLVKRLLGFGGEVLQAEEREGWDLFYTTGDGEETREIFPMPFVVGLKDGVFLAGSLDEDAVEVDPEIEWEDAEGADKSSRLLFAKLDMDALCSSILSPSLAWKEILDSDPVGELLKATQIPVVIRQVIPTREIKSVTLDAKGWDSLDISLEMGYVDYETLWNLLRLSQKIMTGRF